MLGNALSRFAEIECVEVRAGKGKDRLVARGPRFAELAGIAERIAAGIIGP
jgi:hypothetical protein